MKREKLGKMKQTFPLLNGEIVSWTSFQKIKLLVYNAFQCLEVHAVSQSAKDTDFLYSLYIEKKLSASGLRELESFIKGILATIRSF